MSIGKRIAASALIALCFARAGISSENAESLYGEAAKAAREGLAAKLSAEKSMLEARQKYETALAALREIVELYPEWNPQKVSQLMAECSRAFSQLAASVPPLALPVSVAGRQPSEPPQNPPPFIGHRKHKKVHVADCGSVRRMSEQNRIYFSSYQEAADAGYSPCRMCNPDNRQEKQAGASPSSQSRFVGHIGTKKVHRAECGHAQKISSDNRVLFDKYEEAEAAGYAPCKTCKPGRAVNEGTASQPRTPAEAPGLMRKTMDGQALKANGYIAERDGKYFHRAGCAWARNITPPQLVTYRTREEAISSGKNPCEACNP